MNVTLKKPDSALYGIGLLNTVLYNVISSCTGADPIKETLRVSGCEKPTKSAKRLESIARDPS